MSGLSAEERESLAKVMNERRNECRRIFMYDPQIPAYMDVIEPIVNQIANARVEAALAGVQSAFDLQCPPQRSHFADDDFGRGAYCAHSWWNTVLGAALRRAADTT